MSDVYVVIAEFSHWEFMDAEYPTQSMEVVCATADKDFAQTTAAAWSPQNLSEYVSPYVTSWNVAMLWWRDEVLVSRIEVKDGRN